MKASTGSRRAADGRMQAAIEAAFAAFPEVKKIYRRRVDGVLEYYVEGVFADRVREDQFYEKEAEFIRSAPFGVLDIHLYNPTYYENPQGLMPPGDAVPVLERE